MTAIDAGTGVRSRVRRAGRRLAPAAALLLAFEGTAAAQDDEAPTQDALSIQERPGFVEAVQQIAGGKEREGLAALAAILEQHPDDVDLFLLHYNAACGHARLGEKEPAFAELAKALTLGYALHPERFANLAVDPDLASLRSDPRYVELVEQARKQGDEIRGSWEKIVAPFSWVPPAPSPAAGAPALPVRQLPLLVVLHPFGAEREAFARAKYLPFCKEHDFALLAPSGQQILAPGRFAWASESGDFLAQFRRDQRRVWEAVDALCKAAPIDAQRIYVSGVGQGAALGFAVALRNPQWVRGAVLFGGGYAPATLDGWTERSAGFGRRIALAHGEDDALYPIARLPAFVAGLKEKGLAIELVRVAGGHDWPPDAIAAQLGTRIAWIDEVPFKPQAR